MNTDASITAEIQRLIAVLMPHCVDRTTMEALDLMASEPRQWSGGHVLFQAIRTKSLQAIRSGDQLGQLQYMFEEVCAKTLYNSGYPAPFDRDSPGKIHPNAWAFAEALDIAEVRAAIGGAAGDSPGPDGLGASD